MGSACVNARNASRDNNDDEDDETETSGTSSRNSIRTPIAATPPTTTTARTPGAPSPESTPTPPLIAVQPLIRLSESPSGSGYDAIGPTGQPSQQEDLLGNEDMNNSTSSSRGGSSCFGRSRLGSSVEPHMSTSSGSRIRRLILENSTTSRDDLGASTSLRLAEFSPPQPAQSEDNASGVGIAGFVRPRLSSDLMSPFTPGLTTGGTSNRSGSLIQSRNTHTTLGGRVMSFTRSANALATPVYTTASTRFGASVLSSHPQSSMGLSMTNRSDDQGPSAHPYHRASASSQMATLTLASRHSPTQGQSTAIFHVGLGASMASSMSSAVGSPILPPNTRHGPRVVRADLPTPTASNPHRPQPPMASPRRLLHEARAQVRHSFKRAILLQWLDGEEPEPVAHVAHVGSTTPIGTPPVPGVPQPGAVVQQPLPERMNAKPLSQRDVSSNEDMLYEREVQAAVRHLALSMGSPKLPPSIPVYH
eukprot:PhM_4_TR7213/c0_g1_i1/m.104221